jgi:hypothetical protein
VAGRRPGGAAGTAIVIAALAILAVTQVPDLLTVPFVGDDYFVLEKTRIEGLAAVWKPHGLISHYYRPWSRELHYGVLQGLFGLREAPFHAAGLVLWLAVLALYFTLVRRIAGAGTAALAVAGAAALAGWGVLLVWTAGAQDLWMLLFSLAFLHAWERGRTGWAGGALVLALLSKETAAVLPGLALAHALLLDRLPLARALRRVAPLVAIVLAWAVLHPLLGGRLWWPRTEAVLPGLHPPLWRLVLGTLLTLVNLNVWPRPEAGWLAVLPRALLSVLTLGALAVLAARVRPAGQVERARPHTPGRVVALGGAWALLGWLPLLMPTLGWHPYYTLLGALGAWLALGVLLARRPWAGVALVAALAFLRPAVAVTPTEDWGTEWFQRRAAALTAQAHGALLRLRPTLPRGSRVFLSGVPAGTGLVPGGEESPVLRVWYEDPTLRVSWFSRYLPRAPADTAGDDVFLRFDLESGWREVLRGGAGAAPRGVADRHWRADHERLAVALSRGGDWAGAAAEYMALAGVFPDEVAYPYYAGLALAVKGDSTEAVRWLRRAAALPSADAEVRAAARSLELRVD